MKKSIQSILKASALTFVAAAFAFSCSDDDDNRNNGPGKTGESKTYNLTSATDDDITGTVTLSERTDGSTIVLVNLDGTTSGQSHPVYIRSNSITESGDVLIDLEPVNGSSGTSQTILYERNNGTDITYDQLLMLDGTLEVSMSSTDETVVSQADIGSNELTATSRTYTLTSADGSDVGGTVTFRKRMDGSSFVTTSLTGTTTGTQYPMYIYNGASTTPGTVAINLNSVAGSTGATAMNTTNVSALNAGGLITYDDLDEFDGHIGVVTTGAPTTYVASTDIGSNFE